MKSICIFLGSFLCLINISIAQQAPGDNFFGYTDVHTIKITFNQPSYWDSLTLYRQQGIQTGVNQYLLASVEIDGQVIDSIGVRFKGNSSFNSYPGDKKPFKLDFNEFKSGQKYDGMKKLNLNNAFKDPTFMREKLAYDFARNVWLNTPRCGYANLYINNVYFGLYNVVEQVDATFLKNRYGNKDGNLFKGDPQGSLQFFGYMASSYYNKYELKTNETLNDWSDLVNLIDKINNSGPSNFKDSVQKVLNMSMYLKNRAMNILFANLDSYDGSGHNYYIYHESNTYRFEWIPWDVNEAFGNFNQGMTIPQLECLDIFYIPNPQTNRPLAKNAMDNAALKLEYTWYMNQYIQYYFSENYLFVSIDSLYNKIKPHVYADSKKMYTNQQFENNINQNITVPGGPGGAQLPGLKSFITNRRNCVNTQLMQLGYPNVSVQELSDYNAVKVYPNPCVTKFTVDAGNQQVESIEIYNLTGSVVYAEYGIAKQNFTVFNPSLSKGLYIVSLQTTAGLQKIKIAVE